MNRYSLFFSLFLLMPPTILGQSTVSPERSPRALGATAEYVVVELGAIGVGRSEAQAINNVGEVVGYSFTGETSPEGYPVRRAFLWLPTPAYGLSAGLHDLGTLRTDPLGSSQGLDITDAGQVVGSTEVDQTTGFGEPVWLGFSWRDGVMSPLPSPALAPFFLSAHAANELGEVALTRSLGFGCEAYLWLPQANYGLDAGFHRIPPLAGLIEGLIGDLNDQGQIVGKSTGACDVLGGSNSAFLWLPEPDYGLDAGIHDLTPDLADGSEAVATSLNESGQVVGIIDDLLLSPTGFSWDQGVSTLLPFQPLANNEAGWIVGNSSAGPVLWRNGQLHLLADLVAPSAWQLQQATDINDRGQITAVGSHNGQIRALLLETTLIFGDGFESDSTGAWDVAVAPLPSP